MADVRVGLIVTGLIVLVVVVLLVLTVGWLVWRRIRRSGQLRRGILQLRAATAPPGPRREIAQLRLALRDNLTHTGRVLGSLAATGRTPDNLSDLLRRVRATASGLDEHLWLLYHEPDRAFLAATLPSLRARAGTINADALALRQTALRFLEDSDEQTRALLEQDLRDEIAGLQAGLTEIRALRPRPGAAG